MLVTLGVTGSVTLATWVLLSKMATLAVQFSAAFPTLQDATKPGKSLFADKSEVNSTFNIDAWYTVFNKFTFFGNIESTLPLNFANSTDVLHEDSEQL
jgi:hypothetical protein